MDPIAEWTKLEHWDKDGKPFLAEVSDGTGVHGGVFSEVRRLDFSNLHMDIRRIRGRTQLPNLN